MKEHYQSLISILEKTKSVLEDSVPHKVGENYVIKHNNTLYYDLCVIFSRFYLGNGPYYNSIEFQQLHYFYVGNYSHFFDKVKKPEWFPCDKFTVVNRLSFVEEALDYFKAKI